MVVNISANGSAREGMDITVAGAGTGVLATVISLLTISGNSFLLAVIARRPYLHTPAMLVLCSLTVADLMVGLIVMPLGSAELLWVDWPFGLIICDLWHAFDVFASTVSIWSLCLISWDRFSAVKHPVHYNNTATLGRAFRRLSALWIISGIISFPGIAWWRYSNAKNYTEPRKCVFPNNMPYVIASSLLSFFIPFGVLLYSYWRVFETASKHENAIRTGHKRLTKRANRGNDARFRSLYIRVHRGRGKATETELGPKGSPKESSVNTPGSLTSGTPNINISPASRKTKETPVPRGGKARYRSSSHLGLLSESCHFIHGLTMDGEALVEDQQAEDDVETPVRRKSRIEEDRASTSSLSSASSSEGLFINANVNSENFLERIEVTQILITPSSTPTNGRDVSICSTAGKLSPNRSVNDPISSLSPNVVKFERLTASLKEPDQKKKKKKNVKKINSAPAILDPEDSKSSDREPRRTPSTLQKSPTSPALIQKCLVTDRSERRKSRSYFFHTKPRILQEKRAARMLGIVIGGFAICWLPFFLINITAALCSDCVSRRLFQSATWLGYLNSTINPLIYTAFNRELYAAVRETLCCHRRRRISQFRRSIRAVVHNSLSVVPALATRQPPPSVPIHDGPFHHLKPEIINADEDGNDS